jgi:transcription elongation factor GreA
MSEAHEATWLTQAAYDRLATELETLLTTARHEIAIKIAEARDEGDLKENGGYHAAKEEQGKIEARIHRLEVLLSNAVVGEVTDVKDVVTQGHIIKVNLRGNEMEFLLGSAEIIDENDPNAIDVYSPDSPLGAAILGHKVGESVSYYAPNGREFEVEILGVRHFDF